MWTEAASIAMGVMTWWASACRIGAMDKWTHKREVMLMYWAVGTLGLVVAVSAVQWPGDTLVFSTAASLLTLMIVTLPEWKGGPPPWAYQHKEARHA